MYVVAVGNPDQLELGLGCLKKRGLRFYHVLCCPEIGSRSCLSLAASRLSPLIEMLGA